MDHTPIRPVFLLGGPDLEMVAIERLLKRHGQVYHWKPGITWGTADWSVYLGTIEAAIKAGQTPVGIELTANREPVPRGCLLIDHHNEHSHLPSSIEQVAELLGIALSPFEQAVAANDKGHVQAMRGSRLSEGTIRRVRRLDRRAQGHTAEQDEAGQALAEAHRRRRRIKSYPRRYGDVDVIACGEVPFSCVADALLTNKMLLWNERGLMYAGPGVQRLRTAYAGKIDEGKAFVGGDPLGFFGTVEGRFSEPEITDLVELIAHAMKAPFSHHIFLYPFKWSMNDRDRPIEPKEQCIEKVAELIDGRIANKDAGQWKRFDFTAGSDAGRYNEFQYFHPFARKALFENLDPKEAHPIAYYRWKEEVGANGLSPLRYVINIVKRPQWGGKPDLEAIRHELELEEITLTLYESGVGVLGFHLNNRDTEDREAILDINDFGRRLWPPFQANGADRLGATRKNMLAEHITIQRHATEEVTDLAKERFEHEHLDPTSGPEHWMKFRPDHVHYFLERAFGPNVDRIPAVDDRMFTLCWYGNAEAIHGLKDYPVFQGDPAGAWRGFNGDPAHWWYRFVFVDNRSAGIGNRGMLHRLNAEHSYPRFIEDGSVIGMSRYSFVLLSDRGSFGTEHLRVHTQTVYFQIVQLCLAQRASVLRFSEEATDIAKLGTSRERGRLAERLTELKTRYISFVNRIWFREVSPQEQGIELYEMLQAHMDLEKHVKDLNNEIEQLHQFVLLENAKAREDKLELLTKLGFYVAIPTLIAGFYGMNLFSTDGSGNTLTDIRSLWAMAGAFILVLV
ncbi:MAG: hypothetical protein KDC03_24025, partial [Flavobacteriales bacterium]|nr:hypothetical protein [Flavobacteriales bacterium]